MTRTLTATETKATILSLLDEVAAGDEVDITKHGCVVARLVPAQAGRSLRGRFAGEVRTVGDDEAVFSTDATWDLDG